MLKFINGLFSGRKGNSFFLPETMPASETAKYYPNSKVIGNDNLYKFSYSGYWEKEYNICIGNDTTTENRLYLELNNHCLIAGLSGSGKSVFINSLIYQLVYRYDSNEIELFLVDPKQVEFSLYDGLPQVKNISYDIQDTIKLLQDVKNIMERRYSVMKSQHLRKSNEKRLFVIIDEYASISHDKQIKSLLNDLARKSRAANIFLIVATQYPTSQVIDSQLKSNLDTRICFRVRTWNHSKNVLEIKGAENIRETGKGIISYSNGQYNTFNGLYFNENDIETLVTWWIEND